jgi:uncharacterized membrane protein
MNTESAKAWSIVSYALHFIVAAGAVFPGTQGSVGLLLLAFLIDLFTREKAVGSWLDSHYNWRIRSAIWAGILYIVTAPLWILLLAPGWLAWGIISLWFLYRIVRGLINFSGKRAMPA